MGEDKRPLAALGYLTLGRRFLNNPHDIIDDRIDVVTRGMMGLTVACARCHDHKFDPITARDYYSLYGVFASCSEPEEKPLLGTKAVSDKYPQYLEMHQRRLDELNEFRAKKEAEVRAEVRRRTGEYLLAARDIRRLPGDSRAEGLARERKLDPATVQRWAQKLDALSQASANPVFSVWLTIANCSEATILEEGVRRLEALLADGSVNPWVAHAFSGAPPRSIAEAADRYGTLFAEVQDLSERAASSASNQDRATAPLFEDPALEELRQVLSGPESPALVPDGEVTRLFDVPSIQKLRALKRKVEELDATHPGAPPRAMALRDNPTPATPHVLIRGNPANQGPEVPRQFLSVLSGGKPRPFVKGSGRLELARAIASRENPLTARVLVNRVWLHYFGSGLVRTPSDFGLRSEPPSHPELLDYLAARFMDEGWSLKKLHRWIVLSHTYQQTCADDETALKIDPANQWLWRMNRRRLDFEATRDALLAVAGQLDRTMGGHAVEITTEPAVPRRTIYGFVERQNLPGLFRTFDFASPDTTSPQRFSTTVPQQALFLLNSPFVLQQARAVVRNTADRNAAGNEARLRALYRVAYQREPRQREVALGLDFLRRQDAVEPYVPELPAWQYGYGEYDACGGRVKSFQPLPYFTGDSWQGGKAMPDATLGWAQLRAAGGHPGNDRQHAVIRRWIAPRAMTVRIAGSLSHQSEKGDGIYGRIVSSRAGELRGWAVQKAKVDTEVDRVGLEKGDYVDFIVECQGDVGYDGFDWAPAIQALTSGSEPAEGPRRWNARQDFSGPVELPAPMTAWERYAQVLLMSNEFVFLD
ncbi:MAG: DUF1553 domain-containing protein [Verrucomicrobiota bacterium]